MPVQVAGIGRRRRPSTGRRPRKRRLTQRGL